MKKQTIHFVGIKGVGMTPLALIAHEAGFKVTGSDLDECFITDEPLKNAGIKPPFINFSPEHVKGAYLVITTGAHGGMDNPEVKAAKENEIPVLMQGAAVGEFMKGEILERKFRGISVCGTHGKTTTTAMIATILKESGLDPTYLIGTGNAGSLGSPGHLGLGEFFVAEADEYATDPKYNKKAKLLWQRPEIAVLTNIEHDHPDIYPSIHEVKEVFISFVRSLPPEGKLIYCGDNKVAAEVAGKSSAKQISYGFSAINDFQITDLKYRDKYLSFTLSKKKKELGIVKIHVIGSHNVLNSVAALITAMECGVPFKKAVKGLTYFRGTKRRLEYKGQLESGAYLYDDYAHHPTEITTTCDGLHALYPDKNLLIIFQPHTYSRTKILFEQFIKSFSEIKTVIIMNIFASSREPIDSSISSAQIVKRLNKNALFLPEINDVVQYLNKKKYGEDTVILTLGAGDVYKIHDDLKIK